MTVHWPVMSYASAHRYEPLAKARGVSAVARSGRGFMRAFQKAGSWAKLDQWWKDRRNNFVSRHMAQVRTRGENLWKNGKPSRRALALIMWAYMPPRSNPGRTFRAAPYDCRCTATTVLSDGSTAQCMRRATHGDLCTQHSNIRHRDTRKYAVLRKKKNPLYRTGRQLLFSNELPEGRSNKVRYFLRGHEKPWRGGRSGFGPEWDDILDKSTKQARALMAQRNPKTKVVRVKHGRRTLEVRLYKRSR